MNGLTGKRIALLEARLGGELAKLVERRGGEAFSFPALREQTVDAGDEIARLIDDLQTGAFAFIIFQTGVGVSTLFKEADRIGRLEELLAALKTVTTVCRGPKPVAALARQRIKPDVQTREPHTTVELLEAIDPLELKGKNTALLHYGERNEALTEALLARGARLEELCLYEWRMPENTAPLERLIEELDRGAFDAVAFTSQIQARHLFQIAQSLNREGGLLDSLNHKTVVASIGPTCSAALRALGVEPRVEPEHPKMAPLVAAIAEYFDSHWSASVAGRTS
jgi:uroporphyrinogen-III synthase